MVSAPQARTRRAWRLPPLRGRPRIVCSFDGGRSPDLAEAGIGTYLALRHRQPRTPRSGADRRTLVEDVRLDRAP